MPFKVLAEDLANQKCNSSFRCISRIPSWLLEEVWRHSLRHSYYVWIWKSLALVDYSSIIFLFLRKRCLSVVVAILSSNAIGVYGCLLRGARWQHSGADTTRCVTHACGTCSVGENFTRSEDSSLRYCNRIWRLIRCPIAYGVIRRIQVCRATKSNSAHAQFVKCIEVS